MAGDFNGDGRLDLAVTDECSGDISMLLGNGDGTFQAPPPIRGGESGHMPSWRVTSPATATSTWPSADIGSNDIAVLLNKGDGTFQAPAAKRRWDYSRSLSVAGDFNGDGHVDLAVAYDNSNDISVLLGNGDGTFQPAVQYAVGSEPGAIVAGDFNGDGRLDLAVAESGDAVTDPGGVSVLLGNGDGTFQPAVQYAAGIAPGGIVAGDFTGDGHVDLAVAKQAMNTSDGPVERVVCCWAMATALSNPRSSTRWGRSRRRSGGGRFHR